MAMTKAIGQVDGRENHSTLLPELKGASMMGRKALGRNAFKDTTVSQQAVEKVRIGRHDSQGGNVLSFKKKSCSNVGVETAARKSVPAAAKWNMTHDDSFGR